MGMIIYFFAAFIFSIFAAYKSAYWNATQYWGLKLTSTKNTLDSLSANQRISHYMKTINVHGLQSAITPRKEKTKRMASAILNILFFFVGAFSFTWYIPILTLLGILLLKNIIRQFLPPANSVEYLEIIITDLEKQSKSFWSLANIKDKEASDFFIEQLKIIHT
ncbi:hypothetical protein [Gaoshiqia sp. Z1-71]|uniref:hypothetical protein n=1 Tax=Gaoshiqia hydrogeniformans TaxID=3290090 RepID=UPI003BF8FD59